MGAQLHAKFWGSAELKEHKWLRGSVWTESAWRAAQNQSRDAWKKCKAKQVCPSKLETNPIELIAFRLEMGP